MVGSLLNKSVSPEGTVDRVATLQKKSNGSRELRISQPRSIFVSDLHLGCKYGNSQAFLDFLLCHEPEYLYLVGDILDGWRLTKRWYWTECYSQIVHRLCDLAGRGTRLFYTPGNHDDFLRSFLATTSMFEQLEIADQFVHQTADGRRLLILHGDQFDRVVSRHRRLSSLGDRAYCASMLVNRAFNRVWCPLGGRPIHASKYLKQQVKRWTNRLSNFEATVLDYARACGCEGIVCGHIHRPDIKIDPSGLVYYNTGDWVENSSAIIESEDGQLAMIHYAPNK